MILGTPGLDLLGSSFISKTIYDEGHVCLNDICVLMHGSYPLRKLGV